MLTKRRAEDRGSYDYGWLQTAHSFSFSEYRDPAFMGFGPLRVINDDVVAPGAHMRAEPVKPAPDALVDRAPRDPGAARPSLRHVRCADRWGRCPPRPRPACWPS